MIHIELSVTVGRPVGEVFASLTDVERYPEWQGGLTEIKPLVEGPLRPGSRFLEVRSLMGQRIEGTTEIVALEPEKRMCFRGPDGSIPFEGSYAVAAAGGGTRIDVVMDLAPRGFMKMAGVFLKEMFERSLAGNFERFKERMEGA